MTEDRGSSAADRRGDPAGRRSWLRRASLAALLVAYVALACAYRDATPFGEGPDEPGHIAYVSFLRANGRPPRHGEVGEPLQQQVKHPPLYYALGVLATWGHDDRNLYFVPNRQFVPDFFDPATYTAHHHSADELPPMAPRYAFVAALRRLSMILGLVTVLATFALARTVVPGAWSLALAAAAVTAFLPQFLYMSGVANNDALASAVGALSLVAAVRVAVRPPRRLAFAVLGVLLGLGLLAKLTTLALVAVGGLAIGIAARRARSWRVLVRGGAWCGGTLLAVAGTWLMWNVAMGGDVLGWAGFERAAVASVRRTPLWPELPMYFRVQFESFLGRFGWMVIAMPQRLYAAFGGLLVSSAVGWTALGLRLRRRPDDADGVLGPASTRWAVGLLAAAIALVYASVFRLAFTFDLVVAQGRYLFPALSAFSVLFVLGLTGWLPVRWRSAAQLALVVGWLGLGTYGLTHVLQPAFGPVRGSLPIDDPPAAAAMRVDAASAAAGPDFGPGLARLVVDPCAPIARVPSGAVSTWPLTWVTSGRQPDDPLRLFAQLVDADGRVLSADDRIPQGGRYPSSAWLPSRRFTEDIELLVPPVDAPRRATIVAGWLADRGWDARVAVVGGRRDATACGVRTSDVLPEGGGYAWPVVLLPVQPVTLPPTAHVRGDAFGEPTSAVLSGYTIEERLSPGGEPPLLLTLYWTSVAPIPGDETVFVHLTDASGWPGAGADGPPAGGTYPSSLWQPGDVVPDAHHIPTGGRGTNGPLRLSVGWYAPDTGVRRPARDAAGRRWEADEVVLGTVEISQAGVRFEPFEGLP